MQASLSHHSLVSHTLFLLIFLIQSQATTVDYHCENIKREIKVFCQLSPDVIYLCLLKYFYVVQSMSLEYYIYTNACIYNFFFHTLGFLHLKFCDLLLSVNDIS